MWKLSPSSIEDVLIFSTQYRRTTSKLLHALVHRDYDGLESIHSLQERWKLVLKVFSVIHALMDKVAGANVQWWHAWKVLSSKLAPQEALTNSVPHAQSSLEDILPVLPELLKLLAEVAYEFLLHGEEYLSLSSQSSILNVENHSKFKRELDMVRDTVIPQVIAILLVIVHPSQRHIVDHMAFEFAQRYSTIG